MATMYFGPYKPMTIGEMSDLAAKIGTLTPQQCSQALVMLDRMVGFRQRPSPEEWR